MIRNAGGVVTDDEIRSLAISQRLLGTEEIVLIHHTDCGMLTFTDDEFKATLQADTGVTPDWDGETLRRPRRRRQAVDRPDQGQPVHPQEGLGARLRLRGRDRASARGQVATPSADTTETPWSQTRCRSPAVPPATRSAGPPLTSPCAEAPPPARPGRPS